MSFTSVFCHVTERIWGLLCILWLPVGGARRIALRLTLTGTLK